MSEFTLLFSDIEKDVERYLRKFGKPKTNSRGQEVFHGSHKAHKYVVEQYYAHEAFDALVNYALTCNIETVDHPFLLGLSDELAKRRDVTRVKKLWYSMIDRRTAYYWKIFKPPVPKSISEAKVAVLATIKKTQNILLALGCNAEAEILDLYSAEIEEGKKQKLPKLSATIH